MVPDDNQPVRSPLSYADEAGPVYFTADRVFRAVPPEAEPRLRALVASGLLEALAEKGLIPPAKISAENLPGSSFVIEQPRLPFVTYPYEWSYGMFRAAAACVLEVNEIANRFGYELADCHGFNVVFDGPRPQYVDLGSLAPRPAGARDWLALETFARSYEYPLRIWSDGGSFLARRLVAASELMSHADYGLYRWPWLRGGAAARYEKWRHYWFRYRQLSRIPPERIQARLPPVMRKMLRRVIDGGFLPGQKPNLARLRRRVMQQGRSGPEGSWSVYQGDDAGFVNTPRFARVAEIIATERLDSVLELGGNQGYFCDLLLSSQAARQVVCTDAEEAAVDRAHARAARNGSRLHTAVLDCVHPMVNPFGEPPPARLRCDGVVALAVTHHLLLTQRVPVERVLRSMAAYARRFVAIEFMPLGLWDGTQAPPLPPWYNIDWFRAAFGREFDLTHDGRLETNRHLFCGRIRPGKNSLAP